MYEGIHTPPGERHELGASHDIVTNESKAEVISFSTNMKKLVRKLKSDFKCGVNKDTISLTSLSESKLVIFGGPKAMFTSSEIGSIKSYLSSGGSVWVIFSEGGETKLGNNIIFQHNFSHEQNGFGTVHLYKHRFLKS